MPSSRELLLLKKSNNRFAICVIFFIDCKFYIGLNIRTSACLVKTKNLIKGLVLDTLPASVEPLQLDKNHFFIPFDLGEDTNASEIACRAKRNFLSQRDRWWFVALVNCETDKGLKLDYFHLEFKNGDSYNKHFSVDEWYIMETTFVLLYLFIILLIACIVFTIKLKNMGFYHITFKLFTLSLLLKVISYLLYAWAYLKYRTGYESIRIKNLALGFSMLAHIFLIFLVILMAKGYTITRAKLSTKGTFKVMLFIIIFTLIYFVSFVYHVNVFDPGEVLYFYESPPGYTTLGLQILSSFMISYGVFFTVKRYPEKLKFYLPFYVFYSAWILVTPIFAIFSIFVLQDFYRQKIVYGVEGGLSFLSYGFFLILTFPTRANKNFPYHIKTNQIDILEITETGNFPHDPDGQSESSYASSAASGETVTVSVSSRSAETNFIDVFRVDYDMVDPNNRRE